MTPASRPGFPADTCATRSTGLVAGTRGCEQCGAVFQPRREHARFCSARCRAAWNRENTTGGQAGHSALDWSVIAMADTVGRLGNLTVTGPSQAVAVISEAVWWVTIVDATLVRYHPSTYDQALAAQPPARRRLTEDTFTGLRFVRNQLGYHIAPCDFVQPGEAAGRSTSTPLSAWTWKPLPPPALSCLPPRQQDWELSRYQAYQAQLARHTIGETFQRAAAFLSHAAKANGTSVTPGSPQRQEQD